MFYAPEGRSDAVQTRTVDGQEAQIDVTLIFSVDPANVRMGHKPT
jgi:hypothetical protein